MDMGASVIARLKNKAKETGKPLDMYPVFWTWEQNGMH